MSRRQPRVPDPEEQTRRKKEQTEHGATVQMATQAASQTAPDLSEMQSREFVETLFGDHDLNRGDGVPGVEDNRLEERFSAEFSRHLGLANITQEEWERRKAYNRARALLALQEYAKPNGLGSRCRKDIRAAWTDVDEALPVRDDDTYREVMASFDEKTLAESLSVGAKGFDGVTKMHAISHTRSDRDGGSGSSGLLSRFTGGMLG